MQTTTYLEPASTLPQTHTITLPQLWNQKVLAAYLGKSTAWCERARWAGDGPRFIKLGRHVRYKADDVLAWIEDNSKRSTSDGGCVK
jgi:predicted DNA-binding transcriptional regulator AlpA